MIVKSVTVIIEDLDGNTLVVNPDPSQISAIAWNQVNGIRDTGVTPSGAITRELDGTGMFMLTIGGERAAVTGAWYAQEDAPLTVVERRS